jgi:hypothetical protein
VTELAVLVVENYQPDERVFEIFYVLSVIAPAGSADVAGIPITTASSTTSLRIWTLL